MERKRVMIIDDDAETLELMMRQLEIIYHVEGFTSGLEAIEVLERALINQLPQLILLDIIMEEVDGYDVLERLKGADKLKRIPVVFLTGMTDEACECRGLEMDVVDYLKKPVTSKVLLARVHHYLELYSKVEGKGKLNEYMLKAIPDPLTDRELDVARLMAEFRSDREICDILYISMPYTKKLVATVKEKMMIEKRGDIRRYLV